MARTKRGPTVDDANSGTPKQPKKRTKRITKQEKLLAELDEVINMIVPDTPPQSPMTPQSDQQDGLVPSSKGSSEDDHKPTLDGSGNVVNQLDMSPLSIAGEEQIVEQPNYEIFGQLKGSNSEEQEYFFDRFTLEVTFQYQNDKVTLSVIGEEQLGHIIPLLATWLERTPEIYLKRGDTVLDPRTTFEELQLENDEIIQVDTVNNIHPENNPFFIRTFAEYDQQSLIYFGHIFTSFVPVRALFSSLTTTSDQPGTFTLNNRQYSSTVTPWEINMESGDAIKFIN